MKRILLSVLFVIVPILSFCQEICFDTLAFRGNRFIINTTRFIEKTYITYYSDGHGNYSKQYVLNRKRSEYSTDNTIATNFVVYTSKIELPEDNINSSLKVTSDGEKYLTSSSNERDLYSCVWYNMARDVSFYCCFATKEDIIYFNELIDQIKWFP